MRNNSHEIIDVQCREIRTARTNDFSFLIFFAHILAAAIAGAAAFGMISGTVTAMLLVGIAAGFVLLGLYLKSGRRISAVFAVTAFAGLSGVALALANINFSLSLIGLAVGGLSLLALSKINNRGWNHA